jgi:hypothetical protein
MDAAALIDALRDLLAALEDREHSQPGSWERLCEVRARARKLVEGAP